MKVDESNFQLIGLFWRLAAKPPNLGGSALFASTSAASIFREYQQASHRAFRLGCVLSWVVWWRRKSSRKQGSALC